MPFDIEAFFERELPNVRMRTPRGAVRAPSVPGELVIYGPEVPSEAPSKRANKNRSGRAGRKAYNGSKWVSAVGGTKDLFAAMAAPADKELCKVVDSQKGWRDGAPYRSPGQPERK